MTDAMSRGRRLTPEEAARFRQMREQAQAEKAEIVRRLQTEQPGPATWSDFHELRSLVDSLRAEREKRGLTREVVARRAMLDVSLIVELEEHRNYIGQPRQGIHVSKFIRVFNQHRLNFRQSIRAYRPQHARCCVERNIVLGFHAGTPERAIDQV